MDVGTFAASRRERLTAADDALRPTVGRSVENLLLGSTDWTDTIEAAGQLWLENFQAEAPGANYAPALRRFKESIRESLGKTTKRTNTERVTRWLSTITVNDATISGGAAARVAYKMWVTMEDSDVRDIHRSMSGQIVRMGGTFNVAGNRLAYPGEPKGPPEVWIECRCVAMPASREGGAMSANTFTMGPEDEVLDDDNPDIIVGNNVVASADVKPTWASVMLIPAESDPIVAASSEPAHVTLVWMGDKGLDDFEWVEEAVRVYAESLDGPLVVPVSERGTLGDDSADVAFLEPTDSLLALRDGMLAHEPIKLEYDEAEQFPEWTPHVTLGYPETPALAEYDGTEVTFDRIGLWVGDEHWDYPMGGTVTAAATFDMAEVIADAPTEPELVDDMDDEDDDDPITEVPIHGVLAVEGIETGDGRGFRPGALSNRPLPLPYRYEYVSSHGGNQTSMVATVGRIDKVWMEGGEQRFIGAIVLDKPHAHEAIQSIIDGTGMGLSIDADEMSDDVETYTEEYMAAAAAEGKRPTQWYKTTRVSGVTQVPIPAFWQTTVGLGHEFEEDMTEEQLVAAAAALEDCGCADAEEYEVIDLSGDPEANARAATEAIMASGGIIKPGTMALVGEVGHEAVIPLKAGTLNREYLSQIASGTFAPGTKDGPGWITNPGATARIRRYWTKGPGAAKIGWGLGKTPGGDFNRCRAQLAKYVQNPDWLAGLCANMHKEVTGVWPGDRRNRGMALVASGALQGEPAPLVTIIASAHTKRDPYPAEWFQDPKFTKVTPLHVDKATGRVWGHIASWKSCHIGVEGVCRKPPRSASGYANFIHGVVDTTAGEQPVANLTYGIGHANPKKRAAAATAHYDQTDAVWAHVNVGEDEHGIWYAGVIRPGTPDHVIDDVRAIGALSGDWRYFPRFGLDMIAAVSVNTPGYSLAAAATMDWEGEGGQITALGLGMVDPAEEIEGETHDQFVTRVAERVLAIQATKTRQAALQKRAFDARLAYARARLERI